MPRSNVSRATVHLRGVDPLLGELMDRIGPWTLRVEPNRFTSLVRSIVAQQISTKAAAAIRARLEAIVGAQPLTAEAVLAKSPAELRGAGLSGPKTRYLIDLAEQVRSGKVDLEKLHRLPDEEVIAHLLPIKGVGRWTAEMFLIFSLGRLDVLPVDDLGLRAGVQRVYGLAELPGKDELRGRAEVWRPYRSVATWYFWRSLGFVPQSGLEPGPNPCRASSTSRTRRSSRTP